MQGGGQTLYVNVITDFSQPTSKHDKLPYPYPAKLIYLNFQPLEVVSRYRDTQPQVVENYSYLFNLRPNICNSYCLNPHFVPDNSDVIG